MRQAIEGVNWVNVGAFIGLALIAIRVWRERRDRAGAWAAGAFAALGLVVLVARVLPEHPHALAGRIVLRADVVVLLLFPYFLYRFTAAFHPASRRLTHVVGAMTTVLAIWTIALPRLPQSGEPRPAWFIAYVVGFVAHWAILSTIVAVRLWRAGREQPSVARRRMRLLSVASAAITLALVLVAATEETHSPLSLASGLLATSSALLFALALAPPPLLRTVWRRGEQQRLQEAIGSLVQFATSQHEVAARVLGPSAAIVGARGVVVRNADGDVVGAYNVPGALVRALEEGNPPSRLDGDAEVLELDVPGGALVVWTSPYAPFFGDEELRILRTLGALTGLALDRARLFAQERETRLALEQADELKTTFVALAAHELRTPVASVSGIAQTLVHLRHRLDPAQRAELENVLLSQTERLAILAEQLLDLSRLEAEAIEIAPQPFSVREHVEELVTAVAGDRAGAVQVEIDDSLQAVADPVAFERIVSNLLTNALRYGEPPVTVRATHTDRHFHIAVEDRGPGVAADFVPQLFERFTRSELSRQRSGGTGLGLAIARAYANAHRGDLVYEPAEPRGARFKLVLPA